MPERGVKYIVEGVDMKYANVKAMAVRKKNIHRVMGSLMYLVSVTIVPFEVLNLKCVIIKPTV